VWQGNLRSVKEIGDGESGSRQITAGIFGIGPSEKNFRPWFFGTPVQKLLRFFCLRIPYRLASLDLVCCGRISPYNDRNAKALFPGSQALSTDIKEAPVDPRPPAGSLQRGRRRR
jgi:hypothetical protein